MEEEQQLVWRECHGVEEVERLLAENLHGQFEFNALSVSCELLDGHKVVPHELLIEWKVSIERVSELVLRLKAESSSLSLLTILTHVGALLRDAFHEGSYSKLDDHARGEYESRAMTLVRDGDYPGYLLSIATVAKNVGFPTDEMPALKKGIDELNGSAIYPSDELLRLAAAIRQLGNCTHLQGLRIISDPFWLASLIKLPASSFQELCTSISTLPCLRDLTFGRIDLGYDSRLMDAICSILQTAATLRSLSLSISGHLGEDIMEALSKALASPKCVLERLRITWTRLGNEGLDGLLKHLSGSSRLRSLCLCDIGLEDGGVEILVQAAASSKLSSLEVLDLARDWIGDKGFKLFCEALQGGHLPQLRVLTLSDNGFTEEGARSLAAALESASCSLHRLVIWRNDIGYRGVECLMKALPNSNIQHLELWPSDHSKEKDYAEKCYTSVGRALEESSPGCKLKLDLSLRFSSRSSIPVDIAQVFFDGLRKTQTLQKLTIVDKLTPDAQVRLGDCLRHSSIEQLDCPTFEHEDLFQGMLTSKIRKLKIEVNNTNLDMVCDLILANPSCNLQHLHAWEMDIWMQKQMLEALDRNYQSQLEELKVNWISEALKAKCSELLKRNSIFRTTRLSEKEAYVAKLFLCGPSGAGKTTIKTNISRKISLPLPACLQRHPSTSGIELQDLSFNNTKQKLLICDMAGQFEFHAFHHSFLRGFDKSMFLVVLKVDYYFRREDFTIQLVYWLRFIASHKSSSCKQKPKVFIGLNLFHNEGVISNRLQDDVVLFTKRTAQHYQKILDIDLENNIFKVEAVKGKTLRNLKHKLGESLQTLLSQQLKVPGICEDTKDMIMKLKKNKNLHKRQSMQIMEIKDLGEKLLVTYHKHMKITLNEGDKQNIIKFIFLFLHDLGEVVYFDFISKYVILDVQWFIRDVISLFMKPHKIQQSSMRSQQHAVQGLRAAADKLSNHCGGDQAKVDYIFQCLYEMGVLIVMDNGWVTGTWTPLPEKVIVPALSGMQWSYPPFEKKLGEEYKYWGRRLECKDVEFKLFPSGIFAMIQARIHKECKNPSFDVGSGWVTFTEDTIGVYVRIGGDTDSWTDRQWVEIMLWAPHDDNMKAEGMMEKIRGCVADVCTGELEIGEEKVLKTRYVERRMHQPHVPQIQGTQQLNSPELAAPLRYIHKEAEEKGLIYTHTWTRNEGDKLSDLLLPSEQRKHMEKRTVDLARLCGDYEQIVQEVYETPPLDHHIEEKIPTDLKDEDWKKVVVYLDGRLGRIEQQLDRMEESLEMIKATLTKMEKMGKQVLAHCSKMLQSLKGVKCPCSPYLVSEDNKFIRYVHLHNKVRVRYHCEYAEGSHPVDNAEGITVKVPKDWLKTWAPVLIPSLILLLVGVKLGAKFIGVDSFVNDLVDVPTQEMLEIIKGNMGMKTLDLETWKKKLKPTKQDIEQVFEMVRQQSNASDNLVIKRMMRKNFGLQWDTSAHAWLCERHCSEFS